MPRDGMAVPTERDYEAAESLRRLQLRIESRYGQRDPQLFNELLEALDLGVKLVAGNINSEIRARIERAEQIDREGQPFVPILRMMFGETAARS